MDAHDASRMVARLRAAGLKVTPQRIAIIRELAGDPTHPTAQELYDRLRPSMPSMSFATVYNTLASLAEAGLCASRSVTAGGARFDPNTEPHDHAVCDRCGAVHDVPHAAPRGQGKKSRVPEGFSVRAVERIYRGLCASCAGEDVKE